MAPTIAGFLVQGLFDGLVARGCAPEALRERAGLPRGRMFRRLPYHKLDDLMEAGLALTGDENLGLHIHGAVRPESGGALGLLLLACPDLGAALRRVVRFERLLCDINRISIREDPGGAWLEIRLPDEDRPAARHIAEWMLGDHRFVSQTLLGRAVRPVAVEFRHPAPVDVREHERFFGAPITFGADCSRLRVALSDWYSPVRSASSTFREIFERQVHDEMAELPIQRSTGDAVRDVLRGALPGVPSIDEIAKTLRTPARTLQRALRREGVSASRILDELRREQAEQMLANGVDIAEISWRLGYSEPSAFHRAFRRWHDLSPDAWRQGAAATSTSPREHGGR